MKIRILFVDDDPHVLSSLRRAFRRQHDWRMHFSGSPEDALKELDETPYDFVVSDIRMPGMNGMDLLSEIKQKYPVTEVIMMTGMPTIDAAIEAIKLGAAHYLSKPVETKELLEIVERVERERRERAVAGQAAGLIPRPRRRVIGGYEIVNRIDEGSMGIVFLAEKPDIPDRQFALKILKLNQLSEHERPEAIERFRREADIAIRMDHPNIINLIEYGIAEEEQIPYMVMEYFDGTPLDEFIVRSSKGLTLEAKLTILRKIAEALEVIHGLVTCHRDIKPSNIMINAAHEIKLIDFGIAKLPSSKLTLPDCIMGTPAYIAPESIFDTENIDHRADLFALGSVAYELLTGARAFDGDNLVTLARKIWHEPVRPPSEINPAIPPDVEAIVLRLLTKSPAERYQSAREVVEALAPLTNSTTSRS